ncbi:hypothetical protein CYMTET_56446 [Cymbomonas tetramitiformis]|uniref:Uncharacterized protein n=1 Tax=Cymbomonas tetramitiformis TaxID=36881 RepID=A0AAE0BCA8_9CHLO|nr:hypothetical protein CYMTET_56446 [Cymbomonas tetramitiformis]
MPPGVHLDAICTLNGATARLTGVIDEEPVAVQGTVKEHRDGGRAHLGVATRAAVQVVDVCTGLFECNLFWSDSDSVDSAGYMTQTLSERIILCVDDQVSGIYDTGLSGTYDAYMPDSGVIVVGPATTAIHSGTYCMHSGLRFVSYGVPAGYAEW